MSSDDEWAEFDDDWEPDVDDLRAPVVKVRGVHMDRDWFDQLVKLTRCPAEFDRGERREFAAAWIDRGLKRRERRARPIRQVVIRSACCEPDEYIPIGEVYNVPGLGPVIHQHGRGQVNLRVVGPLRGETRPQELTGRFVVRGTPAGLGDEVQLDAIPEYPIILADHEDALIGVRCPLCGAHLDLAVSDVLGAIAEFERTGKASRTVIVS